MKQAHSKPGTLNAIGRPLVVFLLLILVTSAVRAEVRATLDRNTVYDGDTVTLTIEASGRDQSGEPDLSALEKDFDILTTSTSQQIRIVNGKRSDKRQWLVELDPRHPGSITLPALTVGDAQTQPITLTVTEQAPSLAGAGERPVYIKTEIQTIDAAPFVQQQILFSTRLYYRVPLIEGSFEEPRLTDAVVERLGRDKQYKTTVNGQHYQVIERHYAIFAEKSGKLTIPAITFTGRMMSASGRRQSSSGMDGMMERFFGGSPFNDSFFAGTPFGNSGKRIRVRSESLSLDVQPRPAGYRGTHWLPAQRLVLHDSWTDQPPVFKVGEPVTRTITMEAKGLTASQLPAIEAAQVQHVRLYPEQPTDENRTDGQWVFGTRKQSLAYVPAAAGKLSVPAISVSWWDTVNHKQQTAVLPAWEVTVSAAPGGSVEATPAAPAIDPVPADARSDTPAAAADNTAAPSRAARLAQHWRWPAAALIILVAALLILGLRRQRGRHPAGHAESMETPPVGPEPQIDATQRAGQARQALQTACTINDPQAAARALLDWADAAWPNDPPRNLSALAQRLSAGGDAIRELNQSLYGVSQQAWQGQTLWDACQHGLQEKTQTAEPADDSLSPLYPRWGQTR